ncbi:hypothetical protein BpHYR1_017785 [Brachionus plicatilis]|uniref:Uncharacterized protein n=1 Tax=Brachionus plicatilis TaxID=10195 RepID=A0A3M7QUU8_BRAPC|nr:hypothetical protein BpHYR1_017785 [Brachionus plicatilis]
MGHSFDMIQAKNDFSPVNNLNICLDMLKLNTKSNIKSSRQLILKIFSSAVNFSDFFQINFVMAPRGCFKVTSFEKREYFPEILFNLRKWNKVEFKKLIFVLMGNIDRIWSNLRKFELFFVRQESITYEFNKTFDNITFVLVRYFARADLIATDLNHQIQTFLINLFTLKILIEFSHRLPCSQREIKLVNINIYRILFDDFLDKLGSKFQENIELKDFCLCLISSG